MTKEECYFCGSECNNQFDMETGYDVNDCDNCGTYALIEEPFGRKLLDKKYLVTGYLGETKDESFRKKAIKITEEKYKEILNDKLIPKTTMQKLEKVLLYCYRRNEFVGQKFTIEQRVTIAVGGYIYKINPDGEQIGIAYSKSIEELISMVGELHSLGWVHAQYTRDKYNYLAFFTLTAKGLDYAEKLLATNINSNKVFVAIEYHHDYKERFNDAIYPACEDCGFVAFLSEDEQHNNNIMDEMIAGIKQSKFVIADLTHDNSGAYYEAGFAKGLGREVIKCCSKKWLDEKEENKVHFDLAGDSIIMYDDLLDLKKKLKAKIRATIDGVKFEDD